MNTAAELNGLSSNHQKMLVGVIRDGLCIMCSQIEPLLCQLTLTEQKRVRAHIWKFAFNEAKSGNKQALTLGKLRQTIPALARLHPACQMEVLGSLTQMVRRFALEKTALNKITLRGFLKGIFVVQLIEGFGLEEPAFGQISNERSENRRFVEGSGARRSGEGLDAMRQLEAVEREEAEAAAAIGHRPAPPSMFNVAPVPHAPAAAPAPPPPPPPPRPPRAAADSGINVSQFNAGRLINIAIKSYTFHSA
jgi:hypothetical protein